MIKELVLLMLLFFSSSALGEYRDPCVDQFLQSGKKIGFAFFNINQCVIGSDGVDTTRVAMAHNNIDVLTESDRGEEKRLRIQKQVTEFFNAVYERQAQNFAAIERFPQLLESQKILDKLIKHTSSDIFLNDGTLGKRKFSYSANIAPETASDDWISTEFKKPAYKVSFRQIVVGTASQKGPCFDSMTTTMCQLALESMTDWIRFQKAVTTRVHTSYSNARLFDFQDYLNDRAKRWENFFEVANYPFLWESAVNQNIESFNYEKGVYGLSEPPSKQLTIFRPSIAAGFQNGTGENPTLELVIELVGITKWKWVGTEAVGRWGVSLIATYAEKTEDGKTDENPGVGVLFHTPTPSVSFGFVDRENGDDGLIVTYDFLSLYDERKKQLKEERAEFLEKVETKVNDRIKTLQ